VETLRGGQEHPANLLMHLNSSLYQSAQEGRVGAVIWLACLNRRGALIGCKVWPQYGTKDVHQVIRAAEMEMELHKHCTTQYSYFGSWKISSEHKLLLLSTHSLNTNCCLLWTQAAAFSEHNKLPHSLNTSCCLLWTQAAAFSEHKLLPSLNTSCCLL